MPTLSPKWLLPLVLSLLQTTAWGQIRIDSTFATQGISKIAIDDYNEPVKVIKLANDTLLLLCNVTPQDSIVKTDFALIKLTPQGSMDSTFGTNGYVRHRFYKKDISNARAMLQLPNGQLLVLGSGSSYSMPTYLPACLMNLNADGSIDTSFGLGGTLDIQFAGIQEFPTTLSLTSLGQILLGGHTIDSSDTHSEVPVLARLDENGHMDTTFGNGGKVYLRFGAGFINARHLIGGLMYDALEMPDSSVLVSGGYSNVYNLVSYIMRILPSGKIDTAFRAKGFFSANFTPLYNSQIIRMVQATNGKIWFAASSNAIQDKDFYVGNIDLADSTFNTSTVDFSGNEDITSDMLLDHDGDPILVGKSIKAANNHNGYVSDCFAISQQSATGFPFHDRKFTFTDNSSLQCGAASAVLQSNNRLVCFGFQNRPGNTSQLMLIGVTIDKTVGVENVANYPSSILLYPNPVGNQLHLILPVFGAGAYQLSIYNSLGAMVAQHAITATVTIDVSGYAHGIYLLHIANNGYNATTRFVKE